MEEYLSQFNYIFDSVNKISKEDRKVDWSKTE